jgi:hypothetical protein
MFDQVGMTLQIFVLVSVIVAKYLGVTKNEDEGCV